MCIRDSNIETIEYQPDWKQEKIATETLYVYAPLAHRLGLQSIKHTLEDTSFKILFHKQNNEIQEQIIDEIITVTGKTNEQAQGELQVTRKFLENF